MFIKLAKVEISALEIYMNDAYDLLGSRTPLDWNEKSGFNLKSVVLVDGQVDGMIKSICKERIIRKTNFNDASSRGHTLFFMKVSFPNQDESKW